MGILPTIIHEAAHWLTAIIIGIPISEIKIGFYGINPGVSIPQSTPPQYLPYFFYSGGLTSGTLILLLYVFYWIKKYHNMPSTSVWLLSMFTVISITIQLYIGILEGSFYQTYPEHINQYYLILFVIVAIACHAIIFYFVSRHRKKTVT